MNPRTAFSVLRWLIRDTFKQSLAGGIFWLMLAVSLASVVVCLSVPIVDSGDEPGHLDHAVRSLEGQLAGWIANGAGLLLALMWTAGFLPSFLDADTASVLLAKPIPRWWLLVGKCLGAVAFVAVQDTVFLAGTWLALGLRTGVWDTAYLGCLPLLLLQLTIFFSFSALLATVTRSTTACVLGSLLFWLLCWGMNLGRHAFLVLPELHASAAGLGHTLELAYWVLPKPLDCHFILMTALQDDSLLASVLNPHALTEHGAWHPGASLLASGLCAAVLLMLAAYELAMAEY